MNSTTKSTVANRPARTKPDDDLIITLGNRINQHWTKAVQSIFEVASACAEGNKLDSAGKKRLFSLLPFSPATFSKLASIGADNRLDDKSIRQLLPPSLSTIYEVQQLNDQQLQAAVAQGVLNPKVTRAELQKWGRRDAKTPKGKPTEVNFIFYGLVSDGPLVGEGHKALMEGLTALADEFGLQAVHVPLGTKGVRPNAPAERTVGSSRPHFDR